MSLLFCAKIKATINNLRNKKRPSPMENERKSNLARRFLFPAKNNDLFAKAETEMQNIKGTPALISPLSGSMTVEAAIVLPLLLMFFLNLMSAIEMIRLHGNIQAAIWESGRQVGAYGYVYGQVINDVERNDLLSELGGSILSNTVIRSGVIHYLGENYLEESPLTYGMDSLNFWGSKLMQGNDYIDIKVSYQVSPWINLFGVMSFHMCNRYYAHAWTGYELRENSGTIEEDFVYVTEYGAVYHETKECSYLKRTVITINFSEVDSKRNRSGGRYTLCEICGMGNTGPQVYITSDGDRYHLIANCSALKRTILTMPRTEAQDKYEPCGRCGK